MNLCVSAPRWPTDSGLLFAGESATLFVVMSHWIVAALLSALFLGVYELCTKHAIRANAVFPVLFYSTLTGATVWGALLAVDLIAPGTLPAALVTERLSGFQHLQLALKSAIVALSWIFTYFGLKHLPLSLGSPIRATSPSWCCSGRW